MGFAMNPQLLAMLMGVAQAGGGGEAPPPPPPAPAGGGGGGGGAPQAGSLGGGGFFKDPGGDALGIGLEVLGANLMKQDTPNEVKGLTQARTSALNTQSATNNSRALQQLMQILLQGGGRGRGF